MNADRVELEAFAVVDGALQRLVVNLSPAEVSAWSILRYMFRRLGESDLGVLPDNE